MGWQRIGAHYSGHRLRPNGAKTAKVIQTMAAVKRDTQVPDESVEHVAAFTKYLLFAVGVILPLISFRTGVGTYAASPLERLALADVLATFSIIAFLFSTGMRVHAYAALYFYALMFSVIVGVLVVEDSQQFGDALISLIAYSMAFMYWILGYNVGRSPQLAKALILGIAFGVLWESVVIFHDLLFRPQWFVEPWTGRVRGTFRATGQLGQFAFATAGILLTFGWTAFTASRQRVLVVFAGFMCIVFTVVSSLRSAQLSIIVWVIFFLIAGSSKFNTRVYLSVLGIVLLSVFLLVANLQSFSESYAGQRLADALNTGQDSDSFIARQFESAMSTFSTWFPLGIGLGRSNTVTFDGFHEIHNAHLAISVEMGVLGILTFYLLILHPLTRKWTECLPPGDQIAKILINTFILAAFVMMIHNTLHRNRNFLLFIGLASSYCVTRSSDKSRFLVN